MGVLDLIFGRDRRALNDASNLYGKLLAQSRNPGFFGEGRLPDNYDGRVESLTMHLAPVMHRLKALGEQGQRLSQAVYDIMVDDFDVALREEGLTDTGVKKRIKPLVNLFYTRLMTYDAAINAVDRKGAFAEALNAGPFDGLSEGFQAQVDDYLGQLTNELNVKELAELARVDFEFPTVKSI